MVFNRLIYLVLFFLPSLVLSADSSQVSTASKWGRISNFWVIPFVGILLSIAVFSSCAEEFWHHNFGKISLFWAASLILPFLVSQGFKITV
ncbi:MAG: hypothetical protein CM15mP87_01940 [Candidatus Neomarinimicrobiota bacterium]|nr:MAG: hypothetical protein CM15mP87_01940 [Candidatus Neomarinimicrobiota bacterium]